MAIGMVLLAYASVPLYRLFCQATGYGGTTQEAASRTPLTPGKHYAREITVYFNADTNPGLPWQFAPSIHSLKLHVGDQTLTHYIAHNLSNASITGRAVYNVVPFSAGAYFVKVQCFCFNEQTLASGQRVDMPVLFYIDPAILNDHDMDNINTITLSYTFFPVKK